MYLYLPVLKLSVPPFPFGQTDNNNNELSVLQASFVYSYTHAVLSAVSFQFVNTLIKSVSTEPKIYTAI